MWRAERKKAEVEGVKHQIVKNAASVGKNVVLLGCFFFWFSWPGEARTQFLQTQSISDCIGQCFPTPKTVYN